MTQEKQVIEIIKELTPIANKNVHRTYKKYENSTLSCYLNKSELESLAQSLLFDISKKVVSGQIEKQGMYNYFTTSFNNRCKDIIRSQKNTKKRNTIDVLTKDINDYIGLEKIISNNNPESLYEKAEFQEELSNTLKDESVCLNELIQMYFNGYSSKEIQSKLNIKSNQINKYKSKAIKILQKYYQNEDPYFNNDNFNIQELITNKNNYNIEYATLSETNYKNNKPSGIKFILEILINKKQKHTFILKEEAIKSIDDESILKNEFESFKLSSDFNGLIKKLFKFYNEKEK